MACILLPAIKKLVAFVASDYKAKSAKSKKAKRDAKIKALTKSLSIAFNDSSTANHSRAVQLLAFMETEEERMGLMKHGNVSAKDVEDLKKLPLPIDRETLVHSMLVGDEVDGMKLVKWELYQVEFGRGKGGNALIPVELDILKKGDYEVNGFRSKIYMDFGTTDSHPIVVIDMLFQPLDGKSVSYLFNKHKKHNTLPVYSDDQMPPRYSVDEKGGFIGNNNNGPTVLDEKNGAGSFPGGIGDDGKLDHDDGPNMSIRGILARSIRFDERDEDKIPTIKVDSY